jgi:hypothetical protein
VYAWLVKLAAALIAVICVGATSAPAMAVAPTVPPAELVAHTNELPGFAGAKVTLDWSASAFEWGRFLAEGEAEAKRVTAVLLRDGFQEGAQAFFRGRRESGNRHREGLSEAAMFATVPAAEQALVANVSHTLKLHGFKRFLVPSIPGAVGADLFNPHRRGGGGNVLFSTGRCYFLVGNSIHDAKTRAQLDRAPVAAAAALYARTKQLCA